jgi:hypothetical protein
MNFVLILFSCGFCLSIHQTNPYDCTYDRLKLTAIYGNRSWVLLSWGHQCVMLASSIAFADGSEAPPAFPADCDLVAD